MVRTWVLVFTCLSVSLSLTLSLSLSIYFYLLSPYLSISLGYLKRCL